MTDEGLFKFYAASWYRKSPYYERTVRAGVTAFDVYNHMLIPATFGDDPDEVAEYRASLNDVTVWDVAVERQVEITGPDAFDFTNMLTPRDLTNCAVGQCKYVVITADDGGIVNDPILVRLGEHHFWLSISDSDVLLWALGVAHNSGMNVGIREPDASPLQVQGPKSKDVIRELFGDEVAGLKYYWCTEADLNGIPVVVSRTGWSGEVGYEIYLRDHTKGMELWDSVLEAGRPHGIRVIAPSEARRLEAGIFNYGSDMTLENNPFEITGLERLVDLEKQAGYVGKEALHRINREGVKRKLVGVEIEGEPFKGWVVDFWPVMKEGDRVGHATAALHSPRLDKNIGYVWVPIELSGPGTELEIQMPDRLLGATVADLPFIDPKKAVPKG
ncbi:MAG: glycine cleavage T C-terminal barrel domain-containing protein [Actinomycetota bacterium]